MPGMWIFKMTNQGIFLSPKESVPYTKSNLPKTHFVFNDSLQIYWLVELIRAPGNRKVNKVLVKDYGFKTIGSFNHQAKMREIPFLQFEELDRAVFLGLCNSYELLLLERLFSNSTKLASAGSEGRSIYQVRGDPSPEGLPIVQEYPVELKVKFADANIIDGAIIFEKRLEGILPLLLFEIKNPFLKAPYDAIKEYLSKKLGKKTFFVTAKIKTYEGKVVVKDAQSNEIALIDETFIQRIKYKQISSLLRIQQSDGRPIHSVDELLLLSDELQGNLLQTNIENIIQVLTNNFEHRNSKQLSYLAKEHDLEEIIYLTVFPYFGFLFYMKDSNRRSYIWELLDSHATYIWSFVKENRDKEQEFDIVEQSINQIRQVGRNAYKNKYRKGEFDGECRFDTIQHAMDGQSADKMFDEWLAELKTKIEQQELE